MATSSQVIFSPQTRNREWLLLSSMCVGTLWLAQQMADTAIAFASCLTLIVSWLLVRRSCYFFNLRRMTITGFWYFSYLAMLFFPAFVVYSDQEGLYRARYLFAVESVLITVPLGWWLASACYGFRVEEIDFFFEQPVERGRADSRLMGRCWVLLGICFLLTVAYMFDVETIPLFYLLRNPGAFMEAALLREEAFKLLNSPLTYFYYITRGLLFPLVILVALGSYLGSRQRKWLLTFLVAAGGGLFFAALSVAKSPVAVVILLVGILLYLLNHGRMSRKAIAITLILVLLFPLGVIVYGYAGDSIGLAVIMVGVGRRLFYLPAEIVYYYFEYFPDQVHYLHGRSIDKFAHAIGATPFDTTNAVGIYAYPRGLESVSANGAFIADLNADFGMWGVITGGILAGVIMQSVQIFLLRRRKTVVTLACFSFLMVAFWLLESTSLPVVLASDGVILSLLIAWYLERSRNPKLSPEVAA